MAQPFKIIITTSDKYHHILPMLFFLSNKFWGEETEFELVGFKSPELDIPKNFTFVSLGDQPKGVNTWSTTKRKHFFNQPDYFIWMMEDTFIYKPVKHESLEICNNIIQDKRVGRIALSDYSFDQYTNKHSVVDNVEIFRTNELSKYNLSTQISLWNKDYLLRYLKNDLSPWEFECQRKHVDGFHNVCLSREFSPITHNEGVRVKDIHKFNTENFSDSLINELKSKRLI